MVFGDVPIKTALAELVKDVSPLVADEADVLSVHLQVLFRLSHFRKRINDDTEENVEQDDFHEYMETCVVSELNVIFDRLVAIVDRFSVIADASSKSQSLVNDGEVALEHRLAHVFSDPVRVEGIDCVVVKRVLQVEEADSGEDIDDDHS